MATLEQVERLREKANVSYDEAKAALEATNDDLLDAIIYLERQGKIGSKSGFYTSKTVPTAAPSAGDTKDSQHADGQSFSDLLKRFGAFLLKLLHKGNENMFVIYRSGENRTSMPVTALVLFLIFAFWITIPLLVVGLFFGFHYRFDGPDLGKTIVNDPMDSAAKAAEELKNSISGRK